MVNNIKNNTISEINTKKDLNALNKIQYVEIIMYKKRTPGHKNSKFIQWFIRYNFNWQNIKVKKWRKWKWKWESRK